MRLPRLRVTRLFAAMIVAALAAPSVAPAVTAPAGWPVPYLTTRFTGLSSPLFFTGDGTGQRVYVVERGGMIKVAPAGGGALATFLDITTLTTTTSERGLLGLAFSPQYASNRRFYVYYTDTGGDIVLARYLRDPGNPDLALPASRQTILTIEHSSAGNHNGGWIAFGPDGYLYVAVGDGGGSGDPEGDAQNRGSLLGKMLRIDPETGSPTTYTVPADNPFVGVAGARGEVWAYGLRNPWRNSFDVNGDFYVADVGQNDWEELNLEPPATGGRNYGWNRWEGRHPYPAATSPSSSGITFPVAEFSHPAAESITGGYVYRGAKHPAMVGTYVFGDFVMGTIYGTRKSASATWNAPVLADTNYLITSFGTDDADNLYLVSWANGAVYELGDAETFSDRLSGQNRFATAAVTAEESYPGWAGVTDVVIASGDDRGLVDPLAASGLCWAYDAPLLLASATHTPPDTVAALQAIRAATGGPLTLHVVGGSAALPDSRLAALVSAAGAGSTAERVLASGDRYETAAAIAHRMRQVRPGDFPSRALFANGSDSARFADALALAPIARATGSPILLCATASVPATTSGTADDLGLTERYAAGGPVSLDPAVLAALGISEANRLAGANRMATSVAVAEKAVEQLWLDTGTVGIASGLPDALAGGAAVGRDGGVLVFSVGSDLSAEPAHFLETHRNNVTRVWVLGGGNAITDEVRGDVARIRE